MLEVTCPSCQKSMTLNKPKPGKFGPTCKRCETQFRLVITESGGQFSCTTQPVSKPSQDPQTNSKRTHDETVLAENTNSDSEATPVHPRGSNTPTLPTGKETKTAMRHQDSPTRSTQAQGNNLTKNDSTNATVISDRQTSSAPAQLTERLGPYRLISILGEGGMGSVYLAKQTTLDRNVALKVVKSNLTSHKSMLARFTREAYAAAQLVHPNVVQIYDMGDDGGNCYFSMELVEGQSLLELVRKQKRLDPDQAASFILHAARGLRCAHNAGMVHRDVKPANLLVTEDGIVKVADLGLVKVSDQDDIETEVDQAAALSASQDLTRIGSTLGTPYYMAPEQAKSSIDVDHRADIYSLGCTFYVLLTGQKPFDGDTVQELVSKHTSAPIIVPSKLVERVPELLSQIVTKMMAKQPSDRYQTMDELIVELESFLGLASNTAFTPDEQDANLIEKCASAFNTLPMAKFRGIIPLAGVAGSLLFASVMLFVGWKWATAFLILPLAAFASYFTISGILDASVLFAKTRELIVRSGIIAWLKWSAAAMLLVIASLMIGVFPHWLFLSLIGLAAGAGFCFLIDRPIENSRAPTILESEQLLRGMRLKGMDEATLQVFVAKYSGKHWEEFFEYLFGYAAKRRVRDELGKTEIGKQKPKFRRWRDGIADNLQARIDGINHENDQKHLQKTEQAGLVEQGVSAGEAKQQANQMAHALVDHGDSIRVAALQKQLVDLDPDAKREAQRNKVKALLAEARSGKYQKRQSSIQKIAPILNAFLGAYPRFLLGCCLVVGCLLWASQNSLLSVEDLKQSATQALAGGSDQAAQELENAASKISADLQEKLQQPTQPLSIPMLGGVFYNFNSLLAGLILICSVVVLGWRISLFVLPAAFITIFGSSLGIPEILQINHVHAPSALAGIGLLIVGMLFGRSDA
ncbi:MAG: hypothetical protein ACI814_004322 [Mariniblastus sp.]|jgi:hypothetical protein